VSGIFKLPGEALGGPSGSSALTFRGGGLFAVTRLP